MSLSILALHNRFNKIEEVTFELLSKAKKFYTGEISVIVPTNFDNTDETGLLEKYGANKIYFIKNEKLEKYSTIFYKEAILRTLPQINPDILLIGATNNGRDLAPRIAAALGAGLTADCTELSLNEEGKLAATRPTFGGSLMATILSRKTPQMATVRPKVFQKSELSIDNKAEIIKIDVNLEDVVDGVLEVDFTPKTIDNSSLEDADIIVAAGKGIKNQENFELLKKFAKKIGAKVAVSRSLVDSGFAPNNIQVGQTGKTVNPKIYIACGISGAIQHIEGMKNSQTIIAINNDKDAPIFKVADYGIVADLNEFLPKLLQEDEK